MIAQIAEQVRANLSIADLERMLQEKKTSKPSRSSQNVMMGERMSKLKEMKDAAKERRSKVFNADVEKEDAAKEKVEEEKQRTEAMQRLIKAASQGAAQAARNSPRSLGGEEAPRAQPSGVPFDTGGKILKPPEVFNRQHWKKKSLNEVTGVSPLRTFQRSWTTNSLQI